MPKGKGKAKGTKNKDEWETIGLKHGRKNFFEYLAKKEGRNYPGNALEAYLERTGVPSWTDEELREKMAELATQRTALTAEATTS